jgi:hypothetical protein
LPAAAPGSAKRDHLPCRLRKDCAV